MACERLDVGEFESAGCGSVVVGLYPATQAGGAKVLSPVSRTQCQQVASRAGLVLQAYYWDDLTQDPIQQADWLVHILRSEDLPIKWVWIDQEQWWTDWGAWRSAVGRIIPTSSVPAGLPGEISAHFESFMRRLYSQIPQCGVFTNKAFITTWAAGMDRWLPNYPAWVAHFGWQPVQPTALTWDQLKENWLPDYDISLTVGQKPDLLVGHQFTGGACSLPGTYDRSGNPLPLDLSVFSQAFIDVIRGNDFRQIPAPRPEFEEYVVIYKEVNVRAEPSSEAAWVRLAYKDEVLQVVNIEDGWAQIKDGTFVYTGYLARKPETPPSPVTLPLIPPPSLSDTVDYVVLDDRINVRAGPSANSDLLRFAAKGEVVHVVKIENRWAQLLDGSFIFSDTIIKQTTTLHTTEAMSTIVYQEYVVTNARVDVLARPALNSNWMRYAVAGEVLQVIKIENDWAQLSDGNFISAEYIKKKE